MFVAWTLTVLLFASLPNKVNGRCSMYGRCDTVPLGIRYCNVSGEPKLLKDREADHILKNLCPQFYSATGSHTCCDGEQIRALEISLEPMKSLFSSCPACLRNMMNIFCEFVCSPRQSEFIDVLTTGTNNSVTSLNYYITNAYADGIFESCENVGDKSIKFVCNFDPVCSTRKMLQYIGNNDYSPLVMDFVLKDSHVGRFNPLLSDFFPCDSDINGTARNCSCRDCPKVCYKPEYPPESHKNIFGISLASFVIIAVGASFVVLFGSANIIYFSFFERTTYFNQLDQPLLEDSVIQDSKSRHCLVLKLSSIISPFFQKWGKFCFRRRYLVALISCFVAVSLSCGLVRFHSIDDSVKLFLDPKSSVATQKEYFDKNFGPFFRIEQLIVTRDAMAGPYSSLFDKQVLLELNDLVKSIKSLNADFEHNSSVGLSDICYTPLSPSNDNCLIQSVLDYFQEDSEKIRNNSDYMSHIKYCAEHPYSFNDTQINMSCFGQSGVPAEPAVIFGGFQNNEWLQSEALVVTFLVENSLRPEYIRKAEAWERKYLSFLNSYKPRTFYLSYSAQVSIDLESAQTMRDNIPVFCLSILAMFVVLLLTCSFFVRPSRPFFLFLNLKFRLFVTCLFVTFLSLTASVGLLSAAGISCSFMPLVNLIFYVMIVSFINSLQLHHTLWWRTWPQSTSPEDMLGDLVSSVLPGIVASSLIQIAVLFGAYFCYIPVVSIFGLFGAVAIIMNLLLISTVGVASTAFECPGRMECEVTVSPLRNFMRLIFARLVLKNYLRPMIIATFFFWLLVSISSLLRIPFGLEPTSTFAPNSHMYSYLKNQSLYLKSGLPVYFVLPGGFDFSNETFRSAISGSSSGFPRSLSSVVAAYAQQPSRSGIAAAPKNWLDQYTEWIESYSCCRYYEDTNKFCNSTVKSDLCVDCNTSLPFLSYVDWFLQDIPNSNCISGGRAEFRGSVHLEKDHVEATNYMTYHTPSNTSQEYLNAYIEAKKIADFVSSQISGFLNTSVHIFPYSYSYIFFAPYETISRSTLFLFLSHLAVLFAVTTLLTGIDLIISLMVSLTIGAALVTMTGSLAFLGIEFNPVVILNLLMSLGILIQCVVQSAREFALHVDFSKVKRVTSMLEYSGTIVVSGFTFIWFVSSAVLAAMTTPMMYLYYFKTFMMITFVVSAYVLVLLPVLLVYIGPSPLLFTPDEIRYS